MSSPTALPQRRQKRASGPLLVPQAGHTGSTRAPQAVQNSASARLSAWHLGQRVIGIQPARRPPNAALSRRPWRRDSTATDSGASRQLDSRRFTTARSAGLGGRRRHGRAAVNVAARYACRPYDRAAIEWLDYREVSMIGGRAADRIYTPAAAVDEMNLSHDSHRRGRANRHVQLGP